MEAKQLKKLDLSNTKYTRFEIFLTILEGIAFENKTIQYLNIGGMTYSGETQKDSQEAQNAIHHHYIKILAALCQESMTLVHLNISACFPGLQIKPLTLNLKRSFTHKDKIYSSDFSNIGQISKKPVLEPLCEISCLFNAIRASKTLQAVHYSGNSLTDDTFKEIKKILQIKPLTGFGTIVEEKHSELLN